MAWGFYATQGADSEREERAVSRSTERSPRPDVGFPRPASRASVRVAMTRCSPRGMG